MNIVIGWWRWVYHRMFLIFQNDFRVFQTHGFENPRLFAFHASRLSDAMYIRTIPSLSVGLKAHGYSHCVLRVFTDALANDSSERRGINQ